MCCLSLLSKFDFWIMGSMRCILIICFIQWMLHSFLISQAEISNLKVQLGAFWDHFQTLEIKFMKKVYVEHRFIGKCHILHLEFNSFLS